MKFETNHTVEDISMSNKKSDVKAKEAFLAELAARGLTARITGAPADITATDADGNVFYYEIKKTASRCKGNDHFGAATLTEFSCALAHAGNYRFVVAHTDDAESFFEFEEYSPAEFMKFCTIPPFKIYFNIPLDGGRETGAKTAVNRKEPAIRATAENIRRMDVFFAELRQMPQNREKIKIQP